jgi:1-acyl-sn-glycerol-3-phosphate acyltransferase
MWASKWFGWVLSSLGAIPVTRGAADREAMKRAVAVLEAGEPLVLFPEGERKSGPVVQPMFDGAVYIALKAGVPIIPVGIGGSEKVMPKSAKFIYPRKVRVVIGEPIQPNIPTGESSRVPRSAIAEQSATLHAALQRLFDMSMVGVGWSYPPEVAQDQNATND